MKTPHVLNLSRVAFELPPLPAASGADVLAGILRAAERLLERLTASARACGVDRIAAVGRLRGTGRGIHFGDYVTKLEADQPIALQSPFEDSDLVAGAVWDGGLVVGAHCKAALAKLRWSAGADDLPMHVHDFSDRFIIVQEGRGFFHVSNQSIDEFDGSDVRSVPARERDVFVFRRGTVHTFSTLDKSMTLLSCQLPYVAFDDPDQFRIPKHRWIARENPERIRPQAGCDPAWTVLAAGRSRSTADSVLESVFSMVPPV